MSQLRKRVCRLAVVAGVSMAGLPSAKAADLSYLQGLLANTPAGGWVNATQGNWGSTWPSPRPDGNTGAIVYAWGSMAWDSTRGDLILWGGGHANYAGNEVYTWSGNNGLWSRASLPSAIDSNSLVVGNGAPQSSHTYDNNLYLPLADRFVTFGGAAWNSGGNFSSAQGREGPWLWNPALADPNRVGGQNFTGLDPASLGTNSWESRRGSISGSLPPTFVESATGYRHEAGKDVVYIAGDTGASGFPNLYRYEFNPGGIDVVQKVGIASPSAFAYQGTAAIDSQRGWMARTAWGGGNSSDLMVWDLADNNAANPGANPATAVSLVLADGTPYDIVDTGVPGKYSSTGIAFNEESGQFALWNGSGVTYVTPQADIDGTPSSIWLATPVAYTTSEAATSVGQGVHGKWIYVAELDAFMALSDYQASKHVDVWLYKPVAEVPELPIGAMLVPGLALIAAAGRRRRR